MSYGKKILSYKEEILFDLNNLIAFESVPSNEKARKDALNFMLEKANQFGIKSKNIDEIAGHAEIGDGKKLCGVLTHLDVVPVGSGWLTPPFELIRKDGRLYGRGVADNKGAALITLYCLKILNEDTVIKRRNTLRAIFGTSEETCMTDMDLYFSKEPLPDLSFTPDNDFGICTSEKGILQLELFSKSPSNTPLIEFHAGNAVNSVPDKAHAVLYCSEMEDHQLLRLADANLGNFEFNYTADGLKILSKGKAAHSCTPEKGVNAASALINLLCLSFSYDSLGKLFSFLHFRIKDEINGRSLGISVSDKVSGPLTLNLGMVNIDSVNSSASLDIRYPVTANADKILESICTKAGRENIEVKVKSHLQPLHCDENSLAVKILKASYEEVMNEKPFIYSTGGGTYARKLGGNGLAFGPIFKGDTPNTHNANESLNEEKFFKAAEIYLETMYRMLTLPF